MSLVSWMFGDKCSKCGAEVASKASFCPQCGEYTPRARIVCGNCRTALKPTAKFCSNCRTPTRENPEKASPVDGLNRWVRGPEEFARRIEAGDLGGLLKTGLVVEPGTQALIFQGRDVPVAVDEGTYDLNRPLPGIDATVPGVAILVDAGDMRLPLLYPGLHTREDVEVEAFVEAVVQLSDAAAFSKNLLHGRQTLAVASLAEMVWSAGANVIEACVRGTSINDLEGNLEMKASLEQQLRANIAAALERTGLTLVYLQFVRFTSPEFDKIRKKRAETALAGQKVDDMEQRAALNRRIRATLTRDRLDKFSSAKDFEDFVRQTEHEMGMKDVIRAAEMEDLRQTYESKREDAEIARRQLLEKLELEHDLQLRRLHWTGEKEQLEHDLQQHRRELAARQESQWQEYQQQLQMRQSDRGERLADAQAKADEVRMKIGLAGEAIDLRKKKAAQEHEEDQMRIQREQEAKDREARRLLEQQEQLARHEMEKIRAMSEAEQARLAADLKKTEIFQGMSEDQILALMAKDSPHVAAAIAERAKAQAGGNAEVRALYEKILAGKEAESERMERMMARMMESAERIAGGAVSRERQQRDELQAATERGMDRMADVAVAKAGASGSASPASANVICPKCSRQVPAGSKFCDNCGHQFFQ